MPVAPVSAPVPEAPVAAPEAPAVPHNLHENG